jgi:transcription antitermination factor NusG
MFPGFTDEDFEAYAPAKWSSNVYTRQRQEVKQKLVSLGRDLDGTLLSSDGSPLACEASAEYPALWNHKQVDAQHLYFSRSAGARKELDGILDRSRGLASLIEDPTPQRSHIFLSISVFHDRVDIALKLHPDARVDRQNLERKCDDFFTREKLCGLVRALGDNWRCGITTGEQHDATVIDDERLRRVVAALGQPGHHWLFVSRSVARADAATRGAALGDLARASLAALLPIYHFIAWSRENDFQAMREVLQKEKQQRRAKGLARNDHVRIVRGVLAGKMGVVQDFDAKGGLKVLVGKMAVKMDAEDVVKQ